MSRSKNFSLVTISAGKHAFPSRTRPLRPQLPMVVPPRCGVRVGYCQVYAPNPRKSVGGFFVDAVQVESSLVRVRERGKYLIYKGHR